MTLASRVSSVSRHALPISCLIPCPFSAWSQAAAECLQILPLMGLDLSLPACAFWA